MRKKRFSNLQMGDKVLVLTDEGEDQGTFKGWEDVGGSEYLLITATYNRLNKKVSEFYYIKRSMIQKVFKLGS